MRRLLVSAYGCEPNKGSEQGVGWHWVLELAKNAEVWVITRANNRAVIEAALPPTMSARVNFVYFDWPWLTKWKRKGQGFYVYYALWQWGAYRLAAKLLRRQKFDYCLHLTFGNFWLPTFMHFLPIPFIWGPVGGGESVPLSYIKSLPLRARFAQYARHILVRFARSNPFFFGPASAARMVIARTNESANVFPASLQSKVRVMLETAVSENLLERYRPRSNNVTGMEINVVYSGRLIAIKQVAAAIRALALVSSTHPQVRLTIIGDGPMRLQLLDLAQTLDVQHRVLFKGAMSQEDAIEHLHRSDVFLFPSLKEGGSWSLMEAMAAGLPVICMDTTGMRIVTDESCALRIPPTTPADTVTRIAAAIMQLADSAELRHRLGQNAHKRIREHFLWPAKGAFMLSIFTELEDPEKA